MKKALIFVLAGLLAVLLIVGAVVGTLFYAGVINSNKSGGGEQAHAVEHKPKPENVNYFVFEPEFTVNFNNKSARPRFMQIKVAVSAEAEAVEAIEHHMPAIRNELLLLFGEQNSEELLSREGKENLRKKSLSVLREVMKKHTGKEAIEDLYFTNLVMQ